MARTVLIVVQTLFLCMYCANVHPMTVRKGEMKIVVDMPPVANIASGELVSSIKMKTVDDSTESLLVNNTSHKSRICMTVCS